MGEQSTLRITKPDTAQSERALVRLSGTSSLRAVCIKTKERKTVLHTIHGLIVSSCVVFLRYTHDSHGPLWVYTSRMVAERMVAPLGSTAEDHYDY